MRRVQYQVLWQVEKECLLHHLFLRSTLVLRRYEYFLDDCIDRDHPGYKYFNL